MSAAPQQEQQQPPPSYMPREQIPPYQAIPKPPGFQGNPQQIMAEIARIKNPADRQAAMQQFQQEQGASQQSSAPPDGQIAAPPVPRETPAKAVSALETFATNLMKQGLSGGELWRALNEMTPMMNAQTQNEVKMLNAEIAMLKSAETVRHNVNTEATGRQNADSRATTAGAAVTRADAVAANAGGGAVTYRPEDIDRLARRVLAGDSKVYQEIGYTKNAAAARQQLQERVTELAKESGQSVGDQIANRSDYAALSKALGQRQNFVSASNQFITNMEKQAELVRSLAVKGTAGGIPVINKWIQAGRDKVAGDADVTKFDTAIRGLAREHQRIVTGVTSNAQLHVSAQQTADELLNRSQSPEQIEGAIEVMMEEARNAKAAGVGEVDSLKNRIKQLDRREPDSATPGAPVATSAVVAPKVGDKRTINGTPAVWDGKGWKAAA